MVSGLIAALRNLIRRIGADWVILMAAFVTSLLSMVLLTAGPIYADAVSLSALQKTIETAAPTDSNVQVGLRTPASLLPRVDEIVSNIVDGTFVGVGTSISRQIATDTFGFEPDSDGATDALTSFQSLEGIEEHASIIEGNWPTDSGLEAALSAPAAEALGLNVGDVVATTNRRDADLAPDVELVGVFEIDDASDPFWLDDELMIAGSIQSTSFTTFGPMIVDTQVLVDRLTSNRLDVNWRVTPEFANVLVSDVSRLIGRITSMGAILQSAVDAAGEQFSRQLSDFEVSTGVTELLSETTRSLTVTRSSVVGLLVQLAILAGYALVLTAGLLVESRRTETQLVRSRGASPGQIMATSLAEGVLLVVPAALVAPWLATQALEFLNTIGPLAGINLGIDPAIGLEAYLVAGIASLGVIFAMAWPAYQAARESHGAGRRDARETSRFKTQRAGVDIALVAIAVLAFWQLQSLGEQLTTRIQGRFGVDPLLVISPALGLLAGAVLALRIIPLLARVAERIASAGRRAVPALSSWQVARRPVRYARSALLLIMAISIGFFAAAYSSTWLESQSDQASHQVGSDLRVSPNRRTGDSIGDLHLIVAQESIEGVDGSMAVLRKLASPVNSEKPIRVILLDGARADVVATRPDVHGEFVAAANRMAGQRPDIAVVEFPGEPDQVGVTFDVTEEVVFLDPDLFGVEGVEAPLAFNTRASLVIRDGNGMLHRVPAGTLEANVGPNRISADLAVLFEDGTRGTPAYPVSLVAIELTMTAPFPPPRTVKVYLESIDVRPRSGAWRPVDFDLGVGAWDVEARPASGLIADPSIEKSPEQTAGSLTIDVFTSAGFQNTPVLFGIRPRGSAMPEEIPAVVSKSFAQANLADVGDVIRFGSLPNATDRLRVEGVVESFPTIDPDLHDSVIVDLMSYQAMSYRLGGSIEALDEMWIDADGDTPTVLSILEGPVFDSFSVVSREETMESLANDPVALGTIGALALGFIAAAVFAAVGFAVSAAVSARERLTEFALLRAVGLTGRQLGVWLSAEQGVLVISSLIFGTLVGYVLTATILPLIAVTQTGETPIPEVIVMYPWDTIVTLEAVVLAALGIIVLFMTLALRRMGLGSLLRLGED